MAKKPLPSWEAHVANAEMYVGSTAHLGSATNFSVYGEINMANRINRRSRNVSAGLRVTTKRDLDGAYRLNNRLDAT